MYIICFDYELQDDHFTHPTFLHVAAGQKHLLNRERLSQPVSDNQSDIPEYRVWRGEINVLYDLMYFCRSLACPNTPNGY